jgi:hypothetical protein
MCRYLLFIYCIKKIKVQVYLSRRACIIMNGERRNQDESKKKRRREEMRWREYSNMIRIYRDAFSSDSQFIRMYQKSQTWDKHFQSFYLQIYLQIIILRVLYARWRRKFVKNFDSPLSGWKNTTGKYKEIRKTGEKEAPKRFRSEFSTRSLRPSFSRRLITRYQTPAHSNPQYWRPQYSEIGANRRRSRAKLARTARGHARARARAGGTHVCAYGPSDARNLLAPWHTNLQTEPNARWTVSREQSRTE